MRSSNVFDGIILKTCVWGVLMLLVITGVTTDLCVAQVRSSTNYEVTEEVVATGGHEASSTNYTNESTLGQPGTTGINTSTNYENQSGFWHTILVELPVPAISTIGLILLVLGFSVFIFRRKTQGSAF